MEKIKELFLKFKDKEDCSYYEFIDLYDTLLTELTNLNNNHAMELRNMYNHEYAIVKGWPRSSGKNTTYNKERQKGFFKMKNILKLMISDNQCNN